MTQPQDILNNAAGVSTNGNVLPYRVWPGRFPRNIGDVVDNPATQEWNNQYNGLLAGGTADGWAQVKMIAEQIAFKHQFSNGKWYDPGDILIGLGEFLVKQGIL